MKEKLEEIKKLAHEKIKELKNMQELQDLKVQLLGKKSDLSLMLRGLGELSQEERPIVGKIKKKKKRFRRKA